MKLSDLLVSYKLVNVPQDQYTVNLNSPILDNSKYQRMVDYVNKKLGDKTNLNFLGWILPKKEESSYNYTTKIMPNNSVGFKNFNSQFDKFLEKNPQYKDTKNILTAIAYMESNYNLGIKNPNSSATGYFLFIDSTRKRFSNASKQDFISNPDNLFEAAAKYYRLIQNTLKPYLEKIKKSKLTPLLVMYGMWWNPLSVINYLNKGSDSYLSTSDGMTLNKIFNKAKKYENG